MPIDVRHSRPLAHRELAKKSLEDREILGHGCGINPRISRALRLIRGVGGTRGRLSESDPSWAADRVAKHGTRQGSTWVDHVRSEWHVTGTDVTWGFRGGGRTTCRGKSRGDSWDRYIPTEKGESVIAYVGDTLLLATVVTFQEVHVKLVSMMTRTGGVDKWSREHNSPLEYSKLALIDFAHARSSKVRPRLLLPQQEVLPTENAKYLGIIFDQNLNWKAQHARAIGKAVNWTSQIRLLTRSTWGITPKHMRKLYISVAIPRILYAADVWCARVTIMAL